MLPQIDTVLTGQECTSEISLPFLDGTQHHFVRHLFPHMSRDGKVKGYFSTLVDITEAKVTQESQLRLEHQLRSTLVREINHRVKNSLQGLIGLLRLYDAQQANPAALVEHCVSQLMAVAVAFGLASKHGEARILLCDMVNDIAQSVGQVAGRKVSVELLPITAGRPFALSERHSVNISLVINELVFNAIKHSSSEPNPPPVRVVVDRSGESAVVRVINATGTLPDGFSFTLGNGLGTGLNLVKVLAPPEYCDLSITQQPEGIVAVLRLSAPVLSLS
jgi:two-component sensor histidine kinase